jgi:hypothetical protein
VEPPTWQGREAWSRAETARSLDRGLQPVPTLVLFEGEEATVYVRGSTRTGHRELPREDAQRLAWSELFVLGWTLTPEAALVVLPARVRTDDDGALVGEAEGEAAITMEWMRRRETGPPEHGGVVLTYGLDDRGEVVWRDREELTEGGPLYAPLGATVTGRWPAGSEEDERPADLGMPASELACSLRCFGLTVGVARGWYSHYGFDVPIAPGKVRREDRRRAEAGRERSRGPAGVTR